MEPKRRLLLYTATVTLLGVLILLICELGLGRASARGNDVRILALRAYPGDVQAELKLKRVGSNAVPELVTMLHTREHWWQSRVYQANPRLPKWLGRFLARHTRTPAAALSRAAAARGLRTLGPLSQPAIPSLVDALSDPEGQVGWESSVALSQIGPPAVAPLCSALSATNALARRNAALALGGIGPAAIQASTNLIMLLQDPAEEVRHTAGNSLVDITTPRTVVLSREGQPLTEAQRNAARIRYMHDRTLHGYVDPILALTLSTNATTRRQAIETLAAVHVASEVAMQAMTNALSDADRRVRLVAIKALSQIGQKSEMTVSALIMALKDASPEVRENAALGLADIGPNARGGIVALQLLTLDADPNVKAAAKFALEKIGTSP